MTKIFDAHFVGCPSAGSPYKDTKTPLNWKHNVNELDVDELVFITDSVFYQTLNFTHKKKILWVLESPGLINNALINDIKSNHQKFFKILTHDDRLIHLENSINFPTGGCWIKQNDIRLYENKMNCCSIISSNKKFLKGHQLRHEICATNLCFCFGPSYTKLDYKLDALKNYKFHLAIENVKTNYYFTEKLIDCFATGTIPIYWGAKKIDNFFNPKGIIQFDSLEEISEILLNLNRYKIDQKYINENFELAKKYLLPEQRIVNYFFAES